MAINPFGGPATPVVNNRFQAFQSQDDFNRLQQSAWNMFNKAYSREAGRFEEPRGGGRTGLVNPRGAFNFNNRIYGTQTPNLDWQSVQTWSPEYRKMLEMSLMQKIRPEKQVDALGKRLPGSGKSYWQSSATLQNPFGTY